MIKQTIETYRLKKGTKTVWFLDEVKVNRIGENTYNKLLEGRSKFVNVGGSQTYKKTESLVTQISSISPNKQIKTVRKFNF